MADTDFTKIAAVLEKARLSVEEATMIMDERIPAGLRDKITARLRALDDTNTSCNCSNTGCGKSELQSPVISANP
jgi:hypothetical protein